MQTLAMITAALLGLTPIQRAADVHDALGVNIHVEYTDGDYRDVGRLLAALDYIGVRHVRDAAPHPANQGQAGYAQLARAGVKFDLFVNGDPIVPALKRLRDLQHDAPGAIVSLEGPNEVNNHQGFRFEDEADPHRAGVRYQTRLYALAKADPQLASLPVLDFTDYPFTPGRADVENEHPYPPGDKAPGPRLAALVQAARSRAPERPLVFTELGYSTSNADGDVSEVAQARLLLSSLLEACALGVRRTYVYQLLDAYADPGGADHEKHFGLFLTGVRPKPAAKMLHRLTAVLADGAPDARSFTPGAAMVTFTGGGSDVRSLLLQKGSGEQILALWRAAPVFDARGRADVELTPTPVDLRLRGAHGAVVITDVVAQTEGRPRVGTSLLRIPLGSDPLLVQIPSAGRASS